jgi:hypothetical protein
MPDEGRLREQARAAVQNNKLPARRPDRMWGGPGIGALCAVCEKPVTKDELELKLSLPTTAEPPTWTSTTFTTDASPPGSWNA